MRWASTLFFSFPASDHSFGLWFPSILWSTWVDLDSISSLLHGHLCRPPWFRCIRGGPLWLADSPRALVTADCRPSLGGQYLIVKFEKNEVHLERSDLFAGGEQIFDVSLKQGEGYCCGVVGCDLNLQFCESRHTCIICVLLIQMWQFEWSNHFNSYSLARQRKFRSCLK